MEGCRERAPALLVEREFVEQATNVEEIVAIAADFEIEQRHLIALEQPVCEIRVGVNQAIASRFALQSAQYRVDKADSMLQEPDCCRRKKGGISATEDGHIFQEGLAIKVPALEAARRSIRSGEAMEQ